MKQRIQGIFVGFLIATVFLSGTILAVTGNQTLSVTYRDIKLYVDGVLITPKDANGNIVEPFIADGTTYLPIRALSEALGKNVSWDGTTGSVIIGLMPGQVMYFDDVVEAYKTEGYYWQADASKGDHITVAGVKYYHGVKNSGYSDGWWEGKGFYNLDSQYTQLSGMYGSCDDHSAKNLTINFYGDGRLIKSLEFTKDDMPKDFSVDVTGVLQLQVELIGGGASIVNWQIK